MYAGVAFDRVEMAVCGGKDEVEGEMTGETAGLVFAGRGRGREGISLELIEEGGSPFFGKTTGRGGSCVLVGHEHIVGRSSDERGESTADDRGVGAPF
jgi:hypothetical protein